MSADDDDSLHGLDAIRELAIYAMRDCASTLVVTCHYGVRTVETAGDAMKVANCCGVIAVDICELRWFPPTPIWQHEMNVVAPGRMVCAAGIQPREFDVYGCSRHKLGLVHHLRTR